MKEFTDSYKKPFTSGYFSSKDRVGSAKHIDLHAVGQYHQRSLREHTLKFSPTTPGDVFSAYYHYNSATYQTTTFRARCDFDVNNENVFIPTLTGLFPSGSRLNCHLLKTQDLIVSLKL